MRATQVNKSWWLACGGIVVLAAAILLTMGRSPICPCGTIRLWHGVVQSSENSQQLSDWYSLSHIVHGLIFYGVAWRAMRDRPVSMRLAIAMAVESAWEVLENSPVIIDRYRAVTIAYGYAGDSVLNSVSDIACMAIGFAIARRLPIWSTIALGMALELLSLWAIRDNLTLNIVMLIAPNEAIRSWQAG